MEKYRKMKGGEIVEKTDEYISVYSRGKYIPVAECTIGEGLLECNIPYYRRPIRKDLTTEELKSTVIRLNERVDDDSLKLIGRMLGELAERLSDSEYDKFYETTFCL